MGLYLCIFDDEEEIEGLEVGYYSDWAMLIDTIVEKLERGQRGSRFPTLVLHSDSEGVWTPQECEILKSELSQIVNLLKEEDPKPFHAEWQRVLSNDLNLAPQSLFESFIDVDGELLLERLIDLVDLAIKENKPILFQ
jgi:Immunity protein 70